MADPTFTLPTVDELTDIAVTYQGNLLPEDDLSRASDEWARLRVLALMCADTNYNGSIQLADALADSATGAALDRVGVAFGVTRNGATVVTGTNALRLRGTVGAAFAIGQTLTHAGGAQFSLLETGTIPAAGYNDVDITSITAGSGALLEAGQKLAFDSTPTNIEDNAELIIDLVNGGQDVESDAAYRVRVLDAIGRRKLGNSLADWEGWVLEAGTSAISAFIYRSRHGLGTVDVAAFKDGSGDTRALSSTERTALLTELDIHRPLTAQVRVLETVATAADVRVHVVPMPGAAYEPDWITNGVDFTVSAWTLATRVLKLSATRPTSIRPGARIVVNNGTAESVVVEALGPAADEVTLRAPLPSGFAPAAAQAVWPGGPLTEPIREAVKAWIDSLGPRLGSYGTGWKGALYLSDVFLIVQTSTGVLDSEIKTIANAAFTTLEAPEYLYPDDAFVGYLKPGRILVIYTSTL